jgi:hypothetical protein
MQDMVSVACSGVLLLVLTTAIHYEALGALSRVLPSMNVRPRAKLLVVIFAAFASHLVHIVLYAAGFFMLARLFGSGEVQGAGHGSFASYIYFSAETYTSVGFGDLLPLGATRLLAGAEALNGLLLIGWSASYTYLAMERFWTGENGVAAQTRHTGPGTLGAVGSTFAGQATTRSATAWPPSPPALPQTRCDARARRSCSYREEGRSRRSR